MFLADAHTHSRHSVDGHDSIFELSQGAIRQGLSFLCVTDHFDTWSDFDPADYRAEYARAAQRLSGSLELRFGMELGEGHTLRERSELLLQDHVFDFVLGSCHCLDGQPDFYELHYESPAQCRILIETYLDELLSMIAWGKFDALGHLTYPLRYMVGRENVAIDFMCCEDRVRAVFRALAEAGKGIEVNVSGLRRSSFAMPDLPLLKLYRACGGEIVTVGSDAHRATEVGLHIADGYDLLRAAGFSRVAVFRDRVPHFVAI